jgi:hypothetical protein
MTSWTEATSTIGGLRRVLLGILLLGMVGTTTELLLLKHDEDVTQLIPLILLGAGYVTVAWNFLRRTRLSLIALQIVMLCFIASGLLGMMFHYQANVEFQLEMDPQLGGSKLLWQTLQAKTPPALSPGVMVQLGLIGLAYTFRHPAVPRGGNLLEENANEL